MISRLAAIGALLAVAAPASAGAADAPPGAVKLSPNVANRASELRVEIGADALAQNGSGEQPRALALFGARGLRIDRRAVAGRCTEAQADAFDCPASSRIGDGSAQGRAEGVFPGGGIDFTATIDVFLTAPRQSGDIAGVVVQVREPQSGRRFNAKGRIVKVASGAFGTETRFDSPSGNNGQLPPGVTVKLNRVELRVGAKRTVKKRVTVRRNGQRRRVTRRITYSFLTNPRTCKGAWPYRLRVEYPSRTDDYDGSVACRSR